MTYKDTYGTYKDTYGTYKVTYGTYQDTCGTYKDTCGTNKDTNDVFWARSVHEAIISEGGGEADSEGACRERERERSLRTYDLMCVRIWD